MATGRVPTTANSPLTAKGDLFGYSTTQARVPVGSDGETLVADSSATTGLRYNPPVASLTNPTINGGMDVWQRGTSISVAASQSGVYTADRWQMSTGANQACTISRQTVSDSTNLPNIQYALRHQRNSGQTGTTALPLVQSFETTNSIPFAGKTVTLSFYARCGANFSPTSGAFTVYLVTGTGTDQNRLTTVYTGDNTSITAIANATTTWQRFVVNGTIPTTATEMAVYYIWTPTGTAGANDWIEFTGIQIDVGTYTAATAPTFRRAGGNIAGELQAAQRYYYRVRGDEGSSGITNNLGLGTFYSATVFRCPIRYPVKMRRIPDFASSNSANHFLIAANGGVPTYSSVTLDTASVDASLLNVAVTSATGGQSGWLQTNNASAFVDFSAEL